ncbi:MAG: RNA polymerase sigma-70 factor [Carboxylicivirga sp.]|nr:RNA polymerase sigma-70 factor [Carboxylicivirga sp.]
MREGQQNQSIEEQLIGLKNGEERQLNHFFNKFFRHLHYFASQYLNDAVEAENAVQDTFITLWNKRSSLTATTEAGLLSFLYTVLKNNCYHILKRAKRISEQNVLWLKEQEELDRQGLIEMDTSEDTFNEIYKLLFETLDDLPPKCRTVFEMSRFEGLKNKEIAQELCISEKAVEANITRGLKIIRLALKAYMPQLILFFKF